MGERWEPTDEDLERWDAYRERERIVSIGRTDYEELIKQAADNAVLRAAHEQENAALKERIAELEGAGRVAHSLLDGANAVSSSGSCVWCEGRGYDGDGLIHTDDCAVILLRQALTQKPESTEA